MFIFGKKNKISPREELQDKFNEGMCDFLDLQVDRNDLQLKLNRAIADQLKTQNLLINNLNNRVELLESLVMSLTLDSFMK